MKKIFAILSILYLISCATTDEYEQMKMGPALNAENRGGMQSCNELYVGKDDNWLDDENPESLPGGVSDCVDLYLWNSAKGKYFDKCCYIRFQKAGKMHAGCIGLSQENYNDIAETIRRMELGDKTIWTARGINSKIYQLDCGSSYFKYITLAAVFFMALLF
jgi:hypothetical protein